MFPKFSVDKFESQKLLSILKNKKIKQNIVYDFNLHKSLKHKYNDLW
jgi:hypothetical protein